MFAAYLTLGLVSVATCRPSLQSREVLVDVHKPKHKILIEKIFNTLTEMDIIDNGDKDCFRVEAFSHYQSTLTDRQQFHINLIFSTTRHNTSRTTDTGYHGDRFSLQRQREDVSTTDAGVLRYYGDRDLDTYKQQMSTQSIGGDIFSRSSDYTDDANDTMEAIHNDWDSERECMMCNTTSEVEHILIGIIGDLV
jgi:hypothetical protein